MSEVIIFFQTCFIVVACLAYCFTIGKIVSKGMARALFISPIVALLLLLPLRLTSVTLCAITALLFSWLATFKLTLFSFGKGPLASEYPKNITFSRFLALGSLPIIISTHPKLSGKNGDDPRKKVFALKALLFALLYKFVVIGTTSFDSQLHPFLIICIKGILLSLSLDFILVYAFHGLVEAILGLELDPLFNNPMLSTSVQNFWGRRWNLAMGNVLRDSVYDPVRALLSPHIGTKHAQRLGVLATFGVSAMMHEIILYYLSRKRPTWELTWYFLMHGGVVVVEMDVKRRLVGRKWVLPRMVSTIVTFGFLTVSSIMLVAPQIYHCDCDVRFAEEVTAFATFIRSLRSGVVIHGLLNGRVTNLSHFLPQVLSM